MKSRPHVVLIHWHDTGTHLHPYGHRSVPAPNIDRPAAQSVVFERAFATAPLCSPARGSLFTGRYPHSNGLIGLAHLGWEYHANERTLPMLLRDAGYRSLLVGLQHESSDPGTLGCDEVLDLNAEQQYAAPVAELAAVRLRQVARRGEPFLLTVGMFEPHRPFPPELYPPADPSLVEVPGYPPDEDLVRADLAGFYGLTDSTIIVFTTDHGVPFPGAKSGLHDAGLNVALIVRMPGGPARRTASLVSHVDLVPSLLELVGLPVPPAVKGVSLAAELGDGRRNPRSAVYSEKTWHDPDQYDPVRSVRTERYRLIESAESRPRRPIPGDIAAGSSVRGLPPGALTESRPRVQLYDLLADPDELIDRAGDPDFADVLRQHRDLLRDWQDRTGDPLRQRPDRGTSRTGQLRTSIPGRTVSRPLTFRQKGGPDD